jgi:D-amino peptidase
MRVLLWTDMEGMSRVTDHRECWPAFAEYWATGRRAFTDEVLAASAGLLDGGASDVFVVNGHGLGWPNLIWEELPSHVQAADDSARADGFDAMFQVGFHAKAGTAAGFMSHTMVPGLRVAADGELLTESHIWAWLAGIPVLGVAGDAALEDQLDGILSGTPFLPVKRAISRGEAAPVHADHDRSLGALRAFAQECLAGSSPAPLALPRHFTFAASLDPQLADHAEGQHGLERTSPSVLSVDAEDWGRDAQPALEAAMGAALQPLLTAQGELDLSSEAAMNAQDPAALDRFRQFFVEWARATEPAWSN